MSKKSIGTGITRLLFGLRGKDLKVIPYNEMSPQQFEQLDRFLGKLGFILSSNEYTLTKQQSNYVINQIKQLDLYRERIMPGKKPTQTEINKRYRDANPFIGFKPKVIQGGKDKTRPGKIDYNKMSEFLGVKLRGDETFDELLEIEKRMKDKDPEKFAGGGVPGLLAKLRAKFGKKAITTADKIDRPARAKLLDEFKAFEKRNRKLTEDELDELYEEFDEAVPYPMETVADRDRFLKSVQDEKDYMFKQYKAGRLDPKPGEPGRKKFLQKKMEEMEMSGDKKLMTRDEIEELIGYDQKERLFNAKGGLATMFRPKREKFIFGGGVGFKNLIKSLAKKQGMDKPSDVLKKGNPKSQVPKRAKPFVSDRDMADMKQLRIQQLENKLELLKTGRSLLANRDNFPPQFREVGDDMIRMMMPPEMKQMLKGSTVESLDREILQIENVLKNLKVGKDKRALNAEGGRIGFGKGGIFGSGPAPSDVVDSDLLDIAFDNLTLDEIRDILNSIGVDKKAEGGLATMFRPKLKDGGPPNPGRRTFLKLMAGLASIPIVGKLFKPAAKVSSVVPLKNTTTTMPDWFPSFVDKIITRNVGNKIDADLTVFKDKDLPGITVTKHDDGRINVSGQNEYYADYEIDYTPPGYELIDEKTGKAVKTQGEFEAVDADPIPDYDGSIGDYEPRVLENVDEVMSSDVRRMEAYTTGKNEKDIPIKSGEGRVIENEVRADQAADYARENYDGPEDFAKGGLATMFRKK